MTDTTVNLGDFQFASFEVPEQIPFGGEQALTVHKLVGGKRIVDAMGEDPTPPEWSGIFVGSNALDRALYLDGLRKAGQPLTLTWSQLSYTVVIRSFHCDFQRFYRLPYRISCEVVEDLTAPITTIADPSPDDLIADDMDAATALSDAVGDATLTGLMAVLSTVIGTAGTLSLAAPSAIAGILTPLAACRTQVASLITATDLAIGSSAGGAASQQAAALSSQISAMTMQPSLISLDRTLGRVAANLSSINSGTKSVTVAGGDLFTLAAGQYGDAMGWTAIAQANGLSDPSVSGIATLSVPRFTNDTGGVLSA